MPRVEVCCSPPCPEATGVAIHVSSPLYWCPWFVNNRKIQEDLGVPPFPDHIRTVTEGFDSKLADWGSP